ncbi:metacaspase-2-like [Polyergus mexicanus]|uniref:metacaspase-2-like n=1 Tax=Polyergus mexicanus TaxID=615972 RepID=UPI0038B5AA4D
MRPDNSVFIIINALISLVYSLPPNIDWSNLQYDPNSVAQNENILKLFLQLAVHTANRLMQLRNETDRDHDYNGRNDNLSPSIIEAPITRSFPQANLERPDKSQDKIQNRSFIIDSEIKINDEVLLENLDQDQTVLNSTQSQGLYNPSNFQENTNVVRNSKARNLIPMLAQNVQNTSFDIVRRNYDVYNSSQKSINLYTISNPSSADNISFDEQNSQNSTIDGINKRLFNSINLIKNNTNATNINDLTETANKFLPESENVLETTPEVSQRMFGIDLAKNIPGMKIINNLHENVNQQLNQWSGNIPEQSDRNNGVSPRFLDETVIKNFKNIFNPQIVNDLPVMSQILSNAKHFVESMIKILPAPGNAKNKNNLLNHAISQSQNVTNVLSEPIEKDQKHLANFKHKTENSDSQSASVNDKIIKPETFEKMNEIKTNYTNEQLYPILKNLSQSNESEFLKDPATERPLNQSESDASQISSTIEYRDKNSNSTLDLQDSENVNKSNVEKPKELQDNPSTKIRMSRSIGNRNTRIDNDLLKSNNYFRFVDNIKDTNLDRQLSETKPEISDRLIDALLPVIKEKIPNSKSYTTDYYSVTNE